MAPIYRKQFKRDEFLAWLESNGASVLEPTNQYEVVRYKAWTPDDNKRPSTHIVYVRANGTLTYTGMARAHYQEAGL